MRDFSPSIVVKIRSLKHDLRVMTPARLKGRPTDYLKIKMEQMASPQVIQQDTTLYPTDFDLVLLQVFALQ